LLTKLNN
jgi:hypothetical protein